LSFVLVTERSLKTAAIVCFHQRGKRTKLKETGADRNQKPADIKTTHMTGPHKKRPTASMTELKISMPPHLRLSSGMGFRYMPSLNSMMRPAEK
jgi:hypothetical protein